MVFDRGLTKQGYVELKKSSMGNGSTWQKQRREYFPLEQEIIQLLPPYLLSQQRSGLQGFLRLALLFHRQQRLEELGRLRGEDFEGAGVEKGRALWNQTCLGICSQNLVIM